MGVYPQLPLNQASVSSLSLQLTEASLFINSRRSNDGRCGGVGGTFNPFNMTPGVRPAGFLLMVQMSGAGNIQASFPPSELHLLSRKPSELRGRGDISQTRRLQPDPQTALHSQQRGSLRRLHRYRTEPLQPLQISVKALNGCVGG